MFRTRTRIIATIGPACAHPKTLEQMVREGVGVFRFNFSHGTLTDHERLLERVRNVQRKVGHRVGILQDLEGHRIRTGQIAGGKLLALKAGQRFTLYREQIPGDQEGVSLDYPGRFNRIRPNRMIYIDDGKIHLKVLRATENRLVTQVIQEGVLGEHKGVNIPGTPLDFPSISQKDIHDLVFATRNHVDYVAQSFVRNAADVLEVKKRIMHALPTCQVIAKIENREGITNIAAILRAANGIMVARGDLGISVPIYEIPILQKWIIAACNHMHKPAITATQMLEHMIDHPMPTRAEVSDVANAVIDGSDFVMLSGETAAGRYPVETVRMMRTIIEYTERHAPFRGVRRTR
ncbi:MAG: pyruvate kinase [Candidatus Omnitrophica bacterium]|nr:pyruvate kinase [Candidatus Omnitrophota bacterium]